MIFFLLLFAFLLRLPALNQSLWLDEAISAVKIQQYSYTELITSFAPGDFHPPLYYLVLKLWGSVTGYSEIALRFPSVLAAMVAGYFVYRIGMHLKNKTVGFWAATFFMCNPLILYYSQEARMYMLTVAFLAANLWSWYQLQAKLTLRHGIYFAATLALGLFTFYGSVFFFEALGLISLLQKKWRLGGLILVSALVAILCLLPLVSQQFQHSRTALVTVQNWSSVLGTVSLKNLVLIPIKLTSGRISFEPKLVYFGLAGIWLTVITITTALASRSQKILIALLTLPLVFGVMFSFVSPLLQYFRFLYLIIPMSILLALGAERSKLLRYAMAAGFLAWCLAYLLFPQFHREDWQKVSQDVSNSNLPLYMIQSSSDPLQYYAPEKSIIPLHSSSSTEPSEPEILVIPYTAEIHGLQYRALLQGYNYHNTSSQSYRGVTTEVWRKE